MQGGYPIDTASRRVSISYGRSITGLEETMGARSPLDGVQMATMMLMMSCCTASLRCVAVRREEVGCGTGNVHGGSACRHSLLREDCLAEASSSPPCRGNTIISLLSQHYHSRLGQERKSRCVYSYCRYRRDGHSFTASASRNKSRLGRSRLCRSA